MNEDNIKRAIVLLIRENVLTWEGLEQLVYDISIRGLGRRDIVALCSSLMNDPASGLTEEDIDFIGDFSLHLIGQCNPPDIVRLAGDPEGVDELAKFVCGGRWKVINLEGSHGS